MGQLIEQLFRFLQPAVGVRPVLRCNSKACFASAASASAAFCGSSVSYCASRRQTRAYTDIRHCCRALHRARRYHNSAPAVVLWAAQSSPRFKRAMVSPLSAAAFHSLRACAQRFGTPRPDTGTRPAARASAEFPRLSGFLVALLPPPPSVRRGRFWPASAPAGPPGCGARTVEQRALSKAQASLSHLSKNQCHRAWVSSAKANAWFVPKVRSAMGRLCGIVKLAPAAATE